MPGALEDARQYKAWGRAILKIDEDVEKKVLVKKRDFDY
jgi:hypothetical protein